jgi:hypothetical protein
MEPVHIHLLLNHVPVIGTLFGVLLLLGGRLRRSDDLRRAALVFFSICGLLVIPVYMTGEPAEHAVESIPTVSHETIEEHEEVAAFALTGSLLLGLGSAFGLMRYRRGRPFPRRYPDAVLVAAIVVGCLLIWTASVGGQVRHSEIRSGDSSPAGLLDQE